jgi:hypothetical protein
LKKGKKGKGRSRNRRKQPVPSDMDDFDEILHGMQQPVSNSKYVLIAAALLPVVAIVFYLFGLFPRL